MSDLVPAASDDDHRAAARAAMVETYQAGYAAGRVARLAGERESDFADTPEREPWRSAWLMGSLDAFLDGRIREVMR